MEPVPDPAWLARILANAQRAMETSGTAAKELAELTATALKDGSVAHPSLRIAQSWESGSAAEEFADPPRLVVLPIHDGPEVPQSFLASTALSPGF